ncbi:hypothetical protein N8H22_04230 [Stutzerimonas stutzeri]|uniref:hypothetical protein n=1 Tax=Stutzerimonas sp. S1 TaxID=3030652 RepID=UPI0022243E04|nr:hypothetical protein [Stutzerimonas sp. S1]MCW3147812.1 hypothetical protein [Stutzerimonas sp. S1]
MNNNNEPVVALELCRFCAHCIAAIVVAGMLFVGLIGSWSVALNVGLVPLLAIAASDLFAKRQEEALLADI